MLKNGIGREKLKKKENNVCNILKNMYLEKHLKKEKLFYRKTDCLKNIKNVV
jgi:hypothetical protein